jgi:mxaJ protein
MCSRSLSLALLITTALSSAVGAQTPATQPATRILRVVADGNDLPFSNERREGFENKIAAIIARDLNATLEYHWRALRRGYFRETIKSGECDLVMGVPRDLDMALTTEPYYRSAYAFVFRRQRTPIRSFDDRALARLRIGVPLTPESMPPPAIALARRHLIENMHGYSVYADYAQPNPPARIIDAVAAGEIDVAVAWGPLASYFAKRSPVPLAISLVANQTDEPSLPMAFDVSIGVRKKNTALRDELNAALRRHHDEIQSILDAYDVPRVAAAPATQAVPALDRFNPDANDGKEVPGCCD